MRCSALQAAMAKADAIHVQLTAEPTRLLVLSHAPTLLPIEHSSHPGWGIERCAATLNPCEYYGFRPAVVATAQWALAASHAYGVAVGPSRCAWRRFVVSVLVRTMSASGTPAVLTVYAGAATPV